MNSPKAPYQPRAKLMARVEQEFPFACPSGGCRRQTIQPAAAAAASGPGTHEPT